MPNDLHYLSITEAARPSRWAAMPTMAPMVTTPVPPMPPITILAEPAKSISGGP